MNIKKEYGVFKDRGAPEHFKAWEKREKIKEGDLFCITVIIEV